MEELMSPPLVLSACSATAMLFGSALIYFQSMLGSEGTDDAPFAGTR
ncbi:MAG: hypothetical protein K2R98_15555 [Gemmataceae bacterium]|nr:hypothetical protein [Gemmataceae bacterium]